MASDEELFSESDIDMNTTDLLGELEALEGEPCQKSYSPTRIPATPQRGRSGRLDEADTSIFRRLTFASAAPALTTSVGPNRRSARDIFTEERRKQSLTSKLPGVTTTTGRAPEVRMPTNVKDTTMMEILSEVKKTNSTLTEYGERLGSLEQRMSTLEQGVGHDTPSSSSSDTTKTKVSPEVRHLVRDVYKTLLDESEDFVGFDLKKRFTETENQTVLRKILVETKALDDSIHLSQIKAAARRFFQSKQEDLNLREKGKYESKVINQRRRNRIHKKLESRKAALARTNALTEEKKTTWREILIPSFMSSEESGEDDGRPVLFVKSLPWRSCKVSRFVKQMDAKCEKRKSKRAILQTMQRLPGSVSTRLRPPGFEPDFWGFA